jgi:hypothetical protein
LLFSAFENTFDEVEYQTPQNFNDDSENIIHRNKMLSREFTLEPANKEKVGGCDTLTVDRMNGRLNPISVIYFKLNLELWDFVLSIWSNMRDASFIDPLS